MPRAMPYTDILNMGDFNVPFNKSKSKLILLKLSLTEYLFYQIVEAPTDKSDNTYDFINEQQNVIWNRSLRRQFQRPFSAQLFRYLDKIPR